MKSKTLLTSEIVSLGRTGSAASVTSRHRRDEIRQFCPLTCRIFAAFCRRSMDLQGDLQRFWLFLLQVAVCKGGPAAFWAVFAPGHGLQRGTCSIMRGFRSRSRREKQWLQEEICFAHVVKKTPSFEDVSLCGR